jgi:hypothetical protein
MSQNQEIIEAKLCAYIDDELDVAGRADLEKHLAANPQHQRLIEELRRTSGLVRNLPRESAPPELAEGFNSQLERSVLLEGVSEDVAAADLKVPRWPQLVAMAAITLLTVGLAVVVYFALPASGEHPQIVQASPHPNTSVAMSDRDGSLGRDGALGRDGSLGDDRARAMAKTADAPQANSDSAKAVDAVAESEKTLQERLLRNRVAGSDPLAANATEGYGRRAIDLGGASRSGGERAPIVLVMHTDDPSAARNALVLYLVQQKIAWEPAQPQLQQITKKLELDVDELKRKMAEKAPAGPETPADGFAGNLPAATPLAAGQQESLGSTTQPTTLQPTTLPAGKLAAVGGGGGGGALSPESAAAGSAKSSLYQAAIPGSAPNAAATQPAQPVPTVPQPSAQPDASRDESQAIGGRRFDGQPADPAFLRQPTGSRSLSDAPDFSISCKLTAEQAEALRSSLEQPGTSIDPLPAQSGADALSLQKDKDVNLKEHGALQDQAPASKLEGAATPAPLLAPTTGPAANSLADVSPAPAPAPAPAGDIAIDVDKQRAAAPAVAPATQAPATQPAVADAGLLDVVIVVRPADPPIAAPAPAIPATQP